MAVVKMSTSGDYFIFGSEWQHFARIHITVAATVAEQKSRYVS